MILFENDEDLYNVGELLPNKKGFVMYCYKEFNDVIELLEEKIKPKLRKEETVWAYMEKLI